MLQESEHLELSKSARLVGNFANEKELFFMMGKFSPQLKELPGAVDMSGGSTREISAEQRPTTMRVAAVTTPASAVEDERLRAAQTALEREVARPELAGAEADALREVLFGLRERNVTRVSNIWREAFAEVRAPSENVRAAYDQLERYFAK
jgi:hypothetical protein